MSQWSAEETEKIQFAKNTVKEILNVALSYPEEKAGILVVSHATNCIESLVVAGGVFPSLFEFYDEKDLSPVSLKNYINDFDIFILRDTAAHNYYHEHLSKLLLDPIAAEYITKDTEVSKAYRKNNKILEVINRRIIFNNTEINVQFIFTDYIDRNELLASFDFKHSMTSYAYVNEVMIPIQDKLFITRQTFDAITNKELIVHNKLSEKTGIRNRIMKFVARGYRIADPWIIKEFPDLVSGVTIAEFSAEAASEISATATEILDNELLELFDDSYKQNKLSQDLVLNEIKKKLAGIEARPINNRIWDPKTASWAGWSKRYGYGA